MTYKDPKDYKEYVEKNRKRINENALRSYHKNKDKYKKKKALYMKDYLKKPGVKQERKKYYHTWYEDNKEKQSETMKQYRKEHSVELTDYEKNRRPNKIERNSVSKYRQRTYRKTDKGKAHTKRHNYKRRNLGSNEPFPNIINTKEKPVSHHVNNENYVWLPEDIHMLFYSARDTESHRQNLEPIIVQLYPEYGVDDV